MKLSRHTAGRQECEITVMMEPTLVSTWIDHNLSKTHQSEETGAAQLVIFYQVSLFLLHAIGLTCKATVLES